MDDVRMLSKIDKMSLLIEDFQALRAAKHATRLERLGCFLSDFRETRRQLGEQGIGFNDSSAKMDYVVKHAVAKCLPERIEEFRKDVREQIVGFFVYYAEILWSLDATITKHIAGIGENSTGGSE